MIKVGIVGGTGYTGVELLRLLAQHPDVEQGDYIPGDAGTAVSDMFPSLRGRVGLKFEDPAKADLKSCDIVFFATPNGIAIQQAPALLPSQGFVSSISLPISGFAISPNGKNGTGCSMPAPEWVAKAVYGLPK